MSNNGLPGSGAQVEQRPSEDNAMLSGRAEATRSPEEQLRDESSLGRQCVVLVVCDGEQRRDPTRSRAVKQE